MSDLRRINRRNADTPFVLISVSVDRDREQLDLFIEDEEMTWHQVWDPRGTIARAFDVSTFPMFVVIDHEGLVRFAVDGWGPFSRRHAHP